MSLTVVTFDVYLPYIIFYLNSSYQLISYPFYSISSKLNSSLTACPLLSEFKTLLTFSNLLPLQPSWSLRNQILLPLLPERVFTWWQTSHRLLSQPSPWPMAATPTGLLPGPACRRARGRPAVKAPKGHKGSAGSPPQGAFSFWP